MTTRNTNIYHCVSCGRVVHADSDAKPPECCGRAMVMAAAETIREPAPSGEASIAQNEIDPPASKGSRKPR